MPTIVSAINGFTDNYFWKISQGNNCAIVDPGDAKPVLRELKETRQQLTAILITHHHGDHVGGVKQLKQQFNCPVYGPANETIPFIDHPLKQGDRIQVEGLNLSLDIIDIPGHTAGHIGYFGNNHLFCGDTLFAGGCGRLFEGTPEQMLNSLEKLAALPLNTQIYCAHEYTLSNLKFALSVEPDNKTLEERYFQVKLAREKHQATVPSTLTIELATNPFLRTGQPGLKASAEKFLGRTTTSKAQVFAAIRQLKDQF